MTEPPTTAEIAKDAALALTAAAGAVDFVAAVATERSAKVSFATLLTHELGTSHRLMMRLAARADDFLDRAEAADEDGRLGLEAMRAVGAAARMMERYRLGLLALARLPMDKAGRARDRVDHLMWGDDPEDDPSGGPSPFVPPPFVPPSRSRPAPPLPPRSPRVKGFGQLRHDNPSGDLSAAPRCGAGTRAGGACRQPAMANGRCRLHGGKSTGPRTAAGLAHSRDARLVHGARTADAIALRAAAAASGRRLDGLIDAERRILAGHGVDRSNQPPTEFSLGEIAGPSVARRNGPELNDVRGARRRPAAERRPDAPALSDPLPTGMGQDRTPSAPGSVDAPSVREFRILRRLFGEGAMRPLRAVAAGADDGTANPAFADAARTHHGCAAIGGSTGRRRNRS